MNIVVLISGNGSNLQAIIDACKTNKIKGTVRAVFSNKADAFGLERARQAGIATHTLPPFHGASIRLLHRVPSESRSVQSRVVDHKETAK